MAKQIEEGKIGKWLSAPLRRKKLIGKVEASGDRHRDNQDREKGRAWHATVGARTLRQRASNINYFDKEHGKTHDNAKTMSRAADRHYDEADKEGKIAVKRSLTALRLLVKKKSKALGANKVNEETMNPIQAGIKNVQEGNLEQMRNNFNDALARKAAEALQEKKLEVASSYFGQK